MENEYPLSDREFARIRARVHAEAGIALSDSKRTLVVARLGKILRRNGFASFDEYLDHLEGDAGTQDAQDFINALTTNLTRFWREEHHFTHLVQHVTDLVRASAASGAPKRLRIWSAGCSTGQEAYSIALSLLTALPELRNWDFRILATDIDTVVLNKACEGIYPESELNGLAPGQIRLFERMEDGRVRVPDRFASCVAFKHLNLLGSWPMKGVFEAIFCRNVAIYFDKQTQFDLFARFASILTPGGMLYLGHSENLGAQNYGLRAAGKTIYQLRMPAKARDVA